MRQDRCDAFKLHHPEELHYMGRDHPDGHFDESGVPGVVQGKYLPCFDFFRKIRIDYEFAPGIECKFDSLIHEPGPECFNCSEDNLSIVSGKRSRQMGRAYDT